MEYKTKYEQIGVARKTLELSKFATMGEIKAHYKARISKWHPDVCREEKDVCEKMAKKINDAYRCIMEYCAQYQYSFSEETVKRHRSPEQWWAERFGDDPLWGNGAKPK